MKCSKNLIVVNLIKKKKKISVNIYIYIYAFYQENFYHLTLNQFFFIINMITIINDLKQNINENNIV